MHSTGDLIPEQINTTKKLQIAKICGSDSKAVILECTSQNL